MRQRGGRWWGAKGGGTGKENNKERFNWGERGKFEEKKKNTGNEIVSGEQRKSIAHNFVVTK